MKYCTVCKKETKTRIKTSHRYGISKPIMYYEREVCAGCQSPMLLKEAPDFNPHVKVSKQDKRREKRFNQRGYIINPRMSDDRHTVG